MGIYIFSGSMEFYQFFKTENFLKPRLLPSRCPWFQSSLTQIVVCGPLLILCNSFCTFSYQSLVSRQTSGLSDGLRRDEGYFLRSLLQNDFFMFNPKDFVQKERSDKASYNLDCTPEATNALPPSLGQLMKFYLK